MPSWKKLILSGSTATLQSLVVDQNVIANSFTGSLQGTATNSTSASYALTASYISGVSSSILLQRDQFIKSLYPTQPNVNVIGFNGNNETEVGDNAVDSVRIMKRIKANNDGTVSFPFYTFANNSNLGFFRTGSDTIGLASSGTLVLTANSSIVDFKVPVNLTGSLIGTATTASYVLNAISASYSTNTLFANTSIQPFKLTGSNSIISTTPLAGSGALEITQSLFIGLDTGKDAINAHNSNFIGYNTGLNAYSAADSNFFGYQAGYQANTAYQSNFLGSYSGYLASSAYNSNFVGPYSGYSASSAYNSNFIGAASGDGAGNAYNSNFLGYQAGQYSVNAYESNFLGNQAGTNSGNANYSNFLGSGAGYNATNADNSNFLGSGAGYFAISASYSTFIGYNVGSNLTTSHLTSLKSNNIIIGTNITLPDGSKDSINIGGLIFATGSYSTTAGNPFSGSAGGKIGINQPIPQYALDINTNGGTGVRIFSGSLAVGNITPSAIVGRIDASNDVVSYSTSDIRFKENIKPIKNALEKISQIGGYTFDWKSEKELSILHGYEGHDVGVIAQEIESILPEVVTTRDNGYKAVKYDKLVALLIESNKELLKRIEVLESKLN